MTSDSKLRGESVSSALMEKLFFFGSRVVAITAIMQQHLCSAPCLLWSAEGRQPRARVGPEQRWAHVGGSQSGC